MAGRAATHDSSHTSHASPLAKLRGLRHRYGDAAKREKLALLDHLFEHPPRSAKGTAALHDDLLFLRAFPDDAEVHAAALGGLRAVESHVRSLGSAMRHALDDTGIAGTSTQHTYAYGIARWLVEGDEDAEIAWDAFDAPERLDPLVRLSVTHAEADAFDSGEFTTREWLALARGGTKRGALGWLLRTSSHGTGSDVPDEVTVRLLYESLEVPVRWRLTSARATSGNAVDDVALHCRSGMRPSPIDPPALIDTALSGIELLDGARARRWIDASRAALAARCREVHAITYANDAEVWLADLGEGSSLCLIGAAPGDRLTLETNYGYVMFSNGVPIGYGGVTPLAAQANTGVNIFDAFRQSEAAMLFAQALRAFRTLFGVTRFIVNPYQFGAGNDEALQSGAFWLYDRLGFRPADPKVRVVADRERERRSRNRAHRSTLATLRRLAGCDLILELPGHEATPLFEERWLVTVARAVTESLATADAPSRLAKRDEMVASVGRLLSDGAPQENDAALAFGLRRLAPVVSLVRDDVAAWPAADRDALRQLLLAKGSAQERDFAVASRHHERLWTALRGLCTRAEARNT